MARFVVAIAVLAGLVSMAHPVFAESVAASTTNHTQAAAQSESVTPTSPPDASAPATHGLGKAPAGFGWG